MRRAVRWIGNGEVEMEEAGVMRGYPYRKTVSELGYEVAGQRLQDLYLISIGEKEVEVIEEEEEEVGEEEEAPEAFKAKKKTLSDFGEDPYEVLQIPQRWRATAAQIKSSYRKLILVHHPDKQGGEADDTYFKAIQKAWDTLGTKEKRRAYDSSLPFADEIPALNETFQNDAAFYKRYGAVFDRNGMWSEVKPVPVLGDDSTAYEEVEAFYRFWMSFHSWRDYSYLNEYDVKDAESREERRWMEKQNERMQRSKLVEERRRVRKLVENARSLDPRVKRHKEAIEAKRKAEAEARRQKRQEEKERLERERAEREEMERKRKEAEEARILKELAEKSKAKKEIKEEVFAILKAASYRTKRTDAEQICSKFSIAQLQKLRKDLESGEEKVYLDAVDAAWAEEREKAEERKRKEAEIRAREVWSEAEIVALHKAVIRYPATVAGRWETIAGLLGRTKKEVIAKSKELQTAGHARKNVARADDFARFQMNKKEAKQGVSEAESRVIVGVKAWTEDEQKRLEEALRTYPKSLGVERWAKIAAHVGTKSKKECVSRFKFLANEVKQRNK